MKTTIITPVDLTDPVTTYPQCIDNQAVPREIFNKIANNPETLNLEKLLDAAVHKQMGPEVSELWEFQKREYNRSLLFSRKMVLNRIAFWNNPVIISAILSKDLDGLIGLLNQEAILPYLFRENSFDQLPKDFGVVDRGEEAMKTLVAHLDEVTCVRLSADDEENHRKTGGFAMRFRSELSNAMRTDDPRSIHKRIARVLTRNSNTRHDITLLIDKLGELAVFMQSGNNNRDQIYQHFIVRPGTNPAQGYYRDDPFTFELKQWIDLAYNSNLPDILSILTFTPQDFPTPVDLDITWSLNAFNAATNIQMDPASLQDICDRAMNRRVWEAYDVFQKNAQIMIPDPHQLSNSDLLVIRSWDEWHSMMNTLDSYLMNPEFDDDLLQTYTDFNLKLAEYYQRTHSEIVGRQIDKYIPVVSILYRFGKWYMGYIQTQTNLYPILPPGTAALPDLTRNEIKGFFELGLWAMKDKELDWKRSQNIRRMKKAINIKTEEITRMWTAIRKVYPELPADIPGRRNEVNRSSKMEK